MDNFAAVMQFLSGTCFLLRIVQVVLWPDSNVPVQHRVQGCRSRKYYGMLQLCICIQMQLFCKIAFAKIFICSTIDLHTDCECLYTIIMLAMLSLIYLQSADMSRWQHLAEISATLVCSSRQQRYLLCIGKPRKFVQLILSLDFSILRQQIQFCVITSIIKTLQQHQYR